MATHVLNVTTATYNHLFLSLGWTSNSGSAGRNWFLRGRPAHREPASSWFWIPSWAIQRELDSLKYSWSRALSPPAGKQKNTMQLVFTGRNVYLHIDPITSAHRRRMLMCPSVCVDHFSPTCTSSFFKKLCAILLVWGGGFVLFIGPAWTVGDTAPCCFCWNCYKYACDDHRLHNKAQNNSTGGHWGGAEIAVSLSNWNSKCFLMRWLVNGRLALAVSLTLQRWSLI